MEKEKQYRRLLFEQQTPYLQWLRAQEQRSIKLSQQVQEITFSACTEMMPRPENARIEKAAQILLFRAEAGYPAAQAKECMAQWLQEKKQIDLVYADEDYLGTLSELYGLSSDWEDIAALYTEQNQYPQKGLYRGNPWFKPEYSPDTLQSFFYFGSIFAIKREAFERIWRLISDKDWTIYEWICAAAANGLKVGHIDEILYTNQSTEREQELPGVDSSPLRKIESEPETELVSIIIPSKDNAAVLGRCLETLLTLTSYPRFEIILVDNGSSKEQKACITKLLTQKLAPLCEKTEITWLYQEMPFHFSKMCNLGAEKAKGKYLLFLNDDIEICQSDWLTLMMNSAVKPHVGAVGAKLYYPKEEGQENRPYRIQHVGITNMGIGPAHKLAGMEDSGNLYHGHNLVPYNMLAVTGACMLVAKEKFDAVGGFDEELAVAYNDVELCVKLYEAHWLSVQRNDCSLLHHESLSRGQDDTPRKQARLLAERELLYRKHPWLLTEGDPFYSRHLVQWRKDVLYTCNYCYPYEQETKCDRYEAMQTRPLPKIHQNPYRKKLAGENRNLLTIDEISQTQGQIVIKGWQVLQKQDNAGLERLLLLEQTQTRQCYAAVCAPQIRLDVESLFTQESNKLCRTKHAALSGFCVILSKETLMPGEYRIGMLVRTSRRRYLKWSEESVIVSSSSDRNEEK